MGEKARGDEWPKDADSERCGEDIPREFSRYCCCCWRLMTAVMGAVVVMNDGDRPTAKLLS